MEKDKKERLSNLELLRIICILMVLILHYLNGSMGGALNNTVEGTKKYYIINFIESLSIIAVNCFVIISGYFMINKKSIKLDKPIKLMFTAIFYGGILYIVSALLHIRLFSIREFATSLIFVYGTKWFIGSYIALFLLMPFLNRIVIELDRKKYQQLILILLVMFSLLPTIFPLVSYNDSGYGVLNFITLYFIGGYLKLYYKAEKSKAYYFIIYLICSIVTTIAMLSKHKINVWWNYNSIVNIISSISLFMFFSKISIKSKIINYVSTFSFAVYIIHSDSSICIFLFRNVFKCDEYWNSPYLLINMIITILGIYVLCILIDIIRRTIVKLINKRIPIEGALEVST